MTTEKIDVGLFLVEVAKLCAKKNIELSEKDIKLAKRLWDSGSTCQHAAQLIFLNHHSD